MAEKDLIKKFWTCQCGCFLNVTGNEICISCGLSCVPPASLPPTLPDFDGETYAPAFDYERLGKQARRVWDVIGTGGWLTLSEISGYTGDPEASVSARLRDFRKEKFGSMTIEHRRRGDPSAGVWEYRYLEDHNKEHGNGG